MEIKEVESTKSDPDLVTGSGNVKKMAKAETDSQISRWWCHLHRWGRWGQEHGGQELRQPGSRAYTLSHNVFCLLHTCRSIGRVRTQYWARDIERTLIIVKESPSRSVGTLEVPRPHRVSSTPSKEH